MAGPWEDYASTTAPAESGPWTDYAPAPKVDIDVAKNVYPSLGPILSAMGHGAKDGWGDEPLGLAPDAVKWLSDKGIFGPEKGGYQNPFQAFNELLAHTVVGAAQIVGRTGSAALGAYQESMVSLGEQLRDPQFGREMAAMPEAFFGSPHPMGIPKELPPALAERVRPLSEAPAEAPADTVRLYRGEQDWGPYPNERYQPRAQFWTTDLDTAKQYGEPRYIDVSKDELARNFSEDVHGNYQTGDVDFKYHGQAQPLEPGALPPVMAEARDLGVIGPPKPDMAGASPAERAAAEVPPPRIMAAARNGDDVVRGPEPGGPEKAGNIRLDQIGINADAKDVILEAAKNNDDFNQARAGKVPLAQVESLSDASGVPSEALSANDGLGRLMHNDAVVRTWLQAFHQATDEIAGQMKTVAATGDEADIAKLRDMKLRFQHMQEQVSGLTAEAGRTLGVFREFYANKGKAEALGKVLEDNPGLDAGSLKKLADAGKGLDDPAQLARFLHDSNAPTFWDKYLYYWVNALISGPTTHIKYGAANLAFAAYEAGVVTPIAGALGMVRRAVQGGHEGVFVGESGARAFGLLAGTPDALRAAWYAARENVMTPLPSDFTKLVVSAGSDAEAAQILEVSEKQIASWRQKGAPPEKIAELQRVVNQQGSTSAANPMTQFKRQAIEGKLGLAIGIPGRSAAGIHSFFRFLGYRAEIEAQAWRQAAKEGLSPLDGAFFRRQSAIAGNPTEAMMYAGVDNGNHLTFIGEQGSFGKLMSKVSNWAPTGQGGIQPFKLILPFTHIPGQILRASLEQTPAAFLDTKMRADLLGKNGAVAADTQRARLIGGGVIAGMAANWAVSDNVTGWGPTDPTERAQWLRTHEPYSVRLGGWWYSYNKFGPIGDLIGLVANLVEVGPKVSEGEYAEAAGHVVKATGRMLEDEVGMQGLVNLIEAMDDPDRKMARFISGQAASNLPYSSLLRQTASGGIPFTGGMLGDPYMREAKTFVDQLRYNVPWARQDLLPKRDWLGAPMTNPGYGSIIRQRAVNADPIDLAVSQLRGFRPAPPQARIGNVALPPKMYDEYQTAAGAMTRAALEQIVTSPRFGEIPPGIREQIIHSVVERARHTAGAMLQARHPELILQGLHDRKDKINGVKPTKLKDQPQP